MPQTIRFYLRAFYFQGTEKRVETRQAAFGEADAALFEAAVFDRDFLLAGQQPALTTAAHEVGIFSCACVKANPSAIVAHMEPLATIASQT